MPPKSENSILLRIYQEQRPPLSIKRPTSQQANSLQIQQVNVSAKR